MTHIEVEALWEQTERECLGLKDWAKRSHFAALVTKAETDRCIKLCHEGKEALINAGLGEGAACIYALGEALRYGRKQ